VFNRTVTIDQLAVFVGVASVLIVTPGPDMALVARAVLRGGRRGGIATSGGVALGLTVWTLAASIGLAAVLRASEPAFLAVKIAGTSYLVYLGARSLWDALRRRTEQQPRPGAVARPLTVSLRQGLLSNLGNPKIAVFFTSFLPQFAPGRHASVTALLALGFLFCALTLSWLVVYSVLVARAGDVLRRPSIRRLLDALTGLILVGLGARLALERPT
jgi:threonine/homoserine/homoserine lactone efflux protein